MMKSFEQLKEALTSAPVLAYPHEHGALVLDYDSSGNCAGAVLQQVQGGIEKVIGYYSHALSQAEIAYCITRKELLAVKLALVHFHP